MKKLILIVVVSVALLFVGCKSENSNEVSRNTNKVETTAITTTTNSKSGWQHLNEKSEKELDMGGISTATFIGKGEFDGNLITITYAKGKNYKDVRETFSLN